MAGSSTAPALRTSSYTIYVDLPGKPDEILLIHGYSGACDKVSRQVASYLHALESEPAPAPLSGDWSPDPALDGPVSRPLDATIERLKRRGYLTASTRSAEEAYFTRLVGKVHQNSIHTLPDYVLMLTYQCNLRCPYCFQRHMRTEPADQNPQRTMQPEMVDRIFAAIPHIDARHGADVAKPQTRSFVLFGGEPLLAANRPIVALIRQKAEALGTARFRAITNATELHAYEDMLGPECIQSLQVTLDGPPLEHDKRRVYADGTGTFERIARNIDLALARGVQVSVRLNVDRNNVADLPLIVEEFHKRGWPGAGKFSAHAAPIHVTTTAPSRRTLLGSWDLHKKVTELWASDPKSKILAGPDDGIERRMRSVFSRQGDPVRSFRASFCGAHNRMYVLDPAGDIYLCWERTDPKLRIGHIAEDGVPQFDAPADALWRNRTVASNPACRRCRFAFHCGGGCASHAEVFTGSISGNSCDEFGRRFRAAAARAYLDHVANPAQVISAAKPDCDV